VSQMETRWGRRFGRYEIIAELGRGAMGVVYKARDPKIDRFVADKAISLSTHNSDEEREYRERFFHEAQAAGRLLHPGIVTIFDTGEDPESHIAYIVMEYIAGQSLDRMLSEKSKKLPLDAALSLTEELAEALDHAHGQGVIHRDIKPANILVTQDGHTKIADFGIAKMNLAHKTVQGRMLGTPAYMSPEQLEGEAIDNRSDLFSLGAILYRMVTGYGPFQGNSTATVCFKVANRDPLRATALDPELPAELDAIIARAMAKDPAQRYQRGLEFALDLRELRERRRTVPRDPDRPSWFPGTRIARVGNEIGADSPSTNFAIAAFVEAWSHAAGRVPRFIKPRFLLWWRVPALRIGFIASIATIILTVFAYHHPAQTAPRVNQTASASEPPVTVRAAAEPPAGPNQPQTNVYSAVRKTASKTSINPVLDSAKTVANSTKPVADTAKAITDSTLDIQIEHRFSAADLSLWVDDKLAYDHALRGQTKKHWNPFRTDVRETETVRLAAGQHRLMVRVRSAPDKYEQSASILGRFAKDHPAVLRINFERQGNAMRLALR
jgi:tRNA A-37 threonylcarbamoyl transferase component Bud32